MKTLLLEAQLKSHTRVKDGSMNITFHTAREIDTDELTLIDKYWKQNGYVAFKMDEFDGSEMPEDNTKIQGQKSPSLRLRNALFAKHMHKGGTKDGFPAYYNRVLDGFVQSVIDSYE